ncbi:MAG: hypothetical protein BZ138_07165 [Methanosphaera sp. rholeuAM270]|nr:MAG: hypothetical protein BZ138_07165 [Methanosphaera sp. rholeuAM270]
MYTILRLEEKGILTYLMIITNKICSTYDFLTYDTTKEIFVDECFTYDSFITTTDKTGDVNALIEKIGNMIKEVGLENLMYKKISEYEDMTIESVHVPECYQFKNDDTYDLL